MVAPFRTAKPVYNLFAVISERKSGPSKTFLRDLKELLSRRLVAANSRAHFKEYPKVFQISCLYPSSSCTHLERWLFRNVLQRGLMANAMHRGLLTSVKK